MFKVENYDLKDNVCILSNLSLTLYTMGKIILEFDSFEEKVEANDALNGTKWRLAMWDLDQVLRSVERHDVSLFGNHEASEEEYKVCVKIREEMRKILNQANLDLED